MTLNAPPYNTHVSSTGVARNRNKKLVLNIVPVEFGKQTVSIGRIPFTDDEAYRKLRTEHLRTHVFRFDSESKTIANISMRHDLSPLGAIFESEPVHDHLRLLGKVLQHSILEWLREYFTILKPSRPIVFWGKKKEAKLLSSAVGECGLEPQSGIEVIARYSLNTRVLQIPESPKRFYLGLIIDLDTSNVLDLPLGDLINKGFDPIGRYVCRRVFADDPWFRPKPDLIGAVAEIEGNYALLTDNTGEDRVSTEEVFLESRQENLEAVLRILYPHKADQIIKRVQQLRANYVTANGKLVLIRQVLDSLKKRHRIETGDGLTIQLSDLLTSESPLCPEQIETDRPNLLFGAQGRNPNPYPDFGIQKWGPFKYMHNEKNNPTIAVVCEAQQRGRMEQFVQDLCQGFPDEAWDAATSWQEKKQPNPYQGGLSGKFRLSGVNLEFEEVLNPDAQAYRQSASKLLARLPKAPDLAIIQIMRAFEFLYGDRNPYLATKAVFMQAGVPVQAVHKETMEVSDFQLPRILNNMGLASYAKLGGVPWVISARNPTSHELVIGVGYSEMGTTRLAEKTRYVGITTLFQGDGRYQLWGLTREVEFDDYAAALIENLRTTIRYVSEKNDWRPGDAVRLIFHVWKPLKHKEMDAIKEIVRELTADQYEVRYAFLDISHYHPIQLFDPDQQGIVYGTGRRRLRGAGVPDRGIALKLDKRSALLHLTGPKELKMDYQGLPRPLLIQLHEQSDFDDIVYLVRQIFHFTYMSWRSFFPAAEPVTISYSRMIAKALGSLKPVQDWNSSVLTVGPLRGSMWFL